MIGIKQDTTIHFIGVGGVGMSGIAGVLANMGYSVTGSDVQKSANTARLEQSGVKVFIGHQAPNVDGADIVVYSSAVNFENAEIVAARIKNIPIIKRAEMLAELMRLKKGVAIAGSHGKTTTTSILATLMKSLGFDPTYVIGGVVHNLNGNSETGESEYLVAEADESDGSFMFLNPIYAIVTNIDNDHLDYYQNLERLQSTFIDFSNKVPFYGKVFLNYSDPVIYSLKEQINRQKISFSINEDLSADYTATDISYKDGVATFKVLHTGKKSVTFKLKLAGNHNIVNALGAISFCHQLGKSFEEISNSLNNFQGVARRLDTIHQGDSLQILDDYAHHPTEIRATIEAVVKKAAGRKIISIFEPHRYSRTKNFWDDFLTSFEGVDELHILPIFSAGEEAIPYIDSEVMVKSINADTSVIASFIDSYEKIESILRKYEKEQVVILSLGAGPISRNVRSIVERIYG